MNPGNDPSACCRTSDYRPIYPVQSCGQTLVIENTREASRDGTRFLSKTQISVRRSDPYDPVRRLTLLYLSHGTGAD